jgi:hypothetical protein
MREGTGTAPARVRIGGTGSVVPTRTSRDDIEYIVKMWLARLYLTHWTIVFVWDKPLTKDDPAGEALAEIDRYEEYDYAFARFGADFATWTREDANKTIVHELLHLSTRDLEWAADAVEKVLHPDAYKLHAARMKHETEAHVDRMATILVELGGIV